MLPQFLSDPAGWGPLLALIVFVALLLAALVTNLVLGLLSRPVTP